MSEISFELVKKFTTEEEFENLMKAVLKAQDIISDSWDEVQKQYNIDTYKAASIVCKEFNLDTFWIYIINNWNTHYWTDVQLFAKENLVSKTPVYSDHSKKYAKFVLNSAEDTDKWCLFAGKCLMIGVENNVYIRDILEYIFEMYHSMDIEELPQKTIDIKEDMDRYLVSGKTE